MKATSGALLVTLRMKLRFLALGGLMVVVAILVLAWIMGDTQPTRWIETPLAAPSASGKAGS